jgi:ABC-type multidrug transport system ATPase subunit
MICDRVAIISGGRLVTSGPLADLLRGEQHGFEVTLRGVPQDGAHRLGEIGAVAEDRDGARMVRVGSADELHRILQAAIEIGARVDQVVPQRRTLEDLFLAASRRP